MSAGGDVDRLSAGGDVERFSAGGDVERFSAGGDGERRNEGAIIGTQCLRRGARIDAGIPFACGDKSGRFSSYHNKEKDYEVKYSL